MASSLHSDTSSSGSYHPPTGPILKKPYTPVQGAYIVFTLDPVATLEALQDPIASEQAQALPRRKYVGCVVQDWDLASPWRRYNRCSCILLSQGLPKADPAHGVEETMCVPIAPADHPDGRQGVAPSKALPWENLYHHSLLAVDLRLTSKAGDYTDSPRLSRPDLHYMHRFFDNDINRSLSLHREYLAAHPSARSLRESIQSTSPLPLPSQAHMPLPETSSTPPTSVHSEVHIATVDAAPVGPAPMVRPAQFDDPEACDCSPEGSGPRRVSVMGGDEVALYEDRPVVTEAPMASESASIASMSVHSVFERAPDEDDREGSTDVVFQTMADSILGYEDPRDRFLPVADFSLDLSIVTEFCDGCLIDDDFEAIERIKEESEQRTKARLELAEREKLTKWALEVEYPRAI
ncbi:hypothetical protein BV25DRAFT_1917331 [Artomyces pyxidatus]|uniref:Uncharacterized protein n=1 Tax=Artomyces pyxidatus TaxID=48021 RepID=A0ACB8SWD5_9AGAM|nr:hypothetical protein BV25DRAFT_1917331 [Artomyces pyxidatus]